MRFTTVDIKEGKTMIALQEFVQQLTKMQWSDYVDIAVVAVLIYKLMPLIRTPNTMRIARATAALWRLSPAVKAPTAASMPTWVFP